MNKSEQELVALLRRFGEARLRLDETQKALAKAKNDYITAEEDFKKILKVVESAMEKLDVASKGNFGFVGRLSSVLATVVIESRLQVLGELQAGSAKGGEP